MSPAPEELPDGVKEGPPSRANNAADAENTFGLPRARGASRPQKIDEWAVPEEVKALFRNEGNKYYFPDGALAFMDRGRELATPSENKEVIKAFATIAHARGWETVELRGTDRFKKEAWAQSVARGIAVIGYAPSAEERASVPGATVAADPPPNRSSAGTSRPADRKPNDGPLTGQLVEHGSARYQHRPDTDESYFVTVETERGPRTVWGIDLERAFRESDTRPDIGDRVELQMTGRKQVTVKTTERNTAGEWVPIEKATHRNGWVVEKAGFLAERAEAANALRDVTVPARDAVARHPELVGSQLYLKAAEALAARAPVPERDRAHLVAGVREALAEKIERGEPWPVARLREPVRQREQVRERGEDYAR